MQRSLNDPERVALAERVDAILQGQGYLDPSPESVQFPSMRSWVRKLECGLWLTIRSRVYLNPPKLLIEINYPNIQTGGAGKMAMPSVYASLQSDQWEEKLETKMVVIVHQVEDIGKMRCPHCGGYMAERTVKKEGDLKGKKFWGCLSYPDCKGIRAEWKQMVADDEGKTVQNLICPECKAPMAIRYAKKPGPNQGKRFFGCTRYPDCKRIVEKEEAMALRLMDEPDHTMLGESPFGAQP